MSTMSEQEPTKILPDDALADSTASAEDRPHPIDEEATRVGFPLETEENQPGAEHPGHEGLASRSFIGLLITQLLGAMNDNIFRWLAVWVGKGLVPEAYKETAVACGLALLVLPFILLAAPAGYVADRFSKRHVIVACKVAEVLVMILGVAAILSGNIVAMFVVLFLMGSQSAMFGPAKYGSIPEIVRPDRLSAANGLVAMTTIVAIVAGNVIGGALYAATTLENSPLPPGQYNWWIHASVLIGVAGVGLLASLLIHWLPVASPDRAFPTNPAREAARDLGTLVRNRPLFLAALGTMLFWSLGGLFQVNVDYFASDILKLDPEAIGILLGVLAVGVALGNVTAGWISGKHIELGLVPLGAAGIAVGCILLTFVPGGAGETEGIDKFFTASYMLTGLCLVGLGFSAGMYDVPLAAFLQYESPVRQRGAILAASNLMTFTGALLASGLFMALSMAFSGRMIFLLSGLAVLPLVVVIIAVIPGATVRFLLSALMRLFYRVKLEGLDNIPEKGGVLLTPNHVTWADGVLLGMNCPRRPRFVAYADYFQNKLLGWVAREGRIILIRPGRKSMVQSLRTAREALAAGEIVVVFPEGGLTRTGELRKFQPGFLTVLGDTGCPVVPVYLGGLWGSIFSFERGRFFWKWPRRVPYPVTIRFGKPIDKPESPEQVRERVIQLGADLMERERKSKPVLPRQFLRMCRRNRGREKVVDLTGAKLTGGGLLTRTLILRRLLRREVLADDERMVGLLLPPSAGGVVANAAMSIDRRVAVNLNYSASSDVLNHCIKEAGIRHVLTSRRLMERLELDVDAELVYLEDFRERVTTTDKLLSAAAAHLMPIRWLERHLQLHKLKHDDLMTVVFTSGSTAKPKGVMLSYGNIGGNVDSIDRALHLRRDDVLMGILPLFHSFGYTVTLWTVLALDPKGAYHYTPLEARQVGKLCRDHGGTILIGTPTFLRSYARRCDRDDFATLNLVIAGAEKMPLDMADAFERKFGIRPLEGYGATELAPVVSCNLPAERVYGPNGQPPAENGNGNGNNNGHATVREGTIGKPLPDVEVKIVHLESGEDLPLGEEGMLLVRGPNVMLGYLNHPEWTEESIRDGWYVTGDVARLDRQGFITITGRQSRFSKIGGEMVPHLRVEEAIGEIIRADESHQEQSTDETPSEPAGDDGDNDNDGDNDMGDRQVAVTSVPDEKKGERLVVLHTGLPLEPEAICERLRQEGLPPLWVPSPESFRRIDELPLLGSGKLDLKSLREHAEREFGVGG